MTLLVTMEVRNDPTHPDFTGKTTRVITTGFSGCTDDEDAKAKAKAIYDVVKVVSVKPLKGKGNA